MNYSRAEAHLRAWHIYISITNSLLFRDILAKKKLQIISIPPRNVRDHRGTNWHHGALIDKSQMSEDFTSQCKGNRPIEIFVQVLATGRQKYLMTDRSTLESHH